MVDVPSTSEMSWHDDPVLATQPSLLMESQPALKDGVLPAALCH